MYRVVYTSWSSNTLLYGDVVDLARQAATRNEAAQVTGLLLYDGYRFIQALEGEEEVVEATMTRIVNDDRHHRIRIISRESVQQRDFGNWSLHYRRSGDIGQPSTFVAEVKADVASVRDLALKAAFIGFAKLADNRAADQRGGDD